MNIQELKTRIADEAKTFAEWEAFRLSFEELLKHKVLSIPPRFSGAPLALLREYGNKILDKLIESGMTLENAEPAHAKGHSFIRDYINALTIVRLSQGQEDPLHLLIGGLGGMLHDVGTDLVPRYQERTRLIRHAEATAIAVESACAGIIDDEFVRNALKYSIGAHTHYPSDQKVTDEHGVLGVIRAYKDADEDGNPHLMIFLPRWADRLENCGPTHVARHYLTLVEEHHDFDGHQFHEVGFKNQMRPLLRTDAEIKTDLDGRTLIEHVRLYANSQNNSTIYGKHDRGFYRFMRNVNRQRADRILKSTSGPLISQKLVPLVSEIWHQDFLAATIERSPVGEAAVAVLRKNYDALNKKTRRFWATVWFQTMKEYVAWQEIVSQFFDDLPPEYRILAPLEKIGCEPDVVKYTEPKASVRELVSK